MDRLRRWWSDGRQDDAIDIVVMVIAGVGLIILLLMVAGA